MRKFGIFILSSLLFLLVTILIFSINIKRVVNENIIVNLVKTTVVEESVKSLVDSDVAKEQIETIKEKLKTNKEVDELIDKYTNITMDSLSGKDIGDINMEEDIKKFIINNKETIENELNVELDDSKIEKALDKASESGELSKVYKEAMENARSDMSDEAVTVMKMYSEMINLQFQLFLLGGIVILVVLIGLLKDSVYKWMINLGVVSLIAGIINTVLFALFSVFMKLSLSSVKTSVNISIYDNIIIPVGVVVLSIILLIVYSIINKKFKEEDEEVEVLEDE
ncbi:MAG: hypothetical protein E7160_04330 [Firmicutes bacterium]|nr:hypothetical protein [Bacillota bacterium]